MAPQPHDRLLILLLGKKPLPVRHLRGQRTARTNQSVASAADVLRAYASGVKYGMRPLPVVPLPPRPAGIRPLKFAEPPQP